jgi:peptidylprolyl isomerase
VNILNSRKALAGVLSKLTVSLSGLALLAACSSGPGTPAFTRVAPSLAPEERTATASAAIASQPTANPQAASIAPVSIGIGPCVGVKDPVGVSVPADGKSKQWEKPDQVTDPTHTYCAILTTEKGRIVAQLYANAAPQHVNSFVFLARQGFYDGVTWHRVLEGFVAQTGDPTGTGMGGPGYNIPLETVPALRYDRDGVLGMARSTDPNSGGSQFFITFGAQAGLNPGGVSPDGYTIFGQVVEGMDVVRQIAPRDPDKNPASPGDKLVSVRIVDVGVK